MSIGNCVGWFIASYMASHIITNLGRTSCDKVEGQDLLPLLELPGVKGDHLVHLLHPGAVVHGVGRAHRRLHGLRVHAGENTRYRVLRPGVCLRSRHRNVLNNDTNVKIGTK